MPCLTGFFTIIGLIPENRKMGARITKIKKRAKQKPYRVFSHHVLCWNSGVSFL